MDIAETVRILRLFNEKADKLEQSRFAQTMQSGSSFTVGYKRDEGITSSRVGPNGEMIDAAILTFRMFIQKKDVQSLWKIREIYSPLPVDEKIKTNIALVVGSFEKLWAGTTFVNIDGDFLTYGKIVDVFLYGDLSHTMNKAKRAEYESWVEMGPIFPLLQDMFCQSVNGIIFAVKQICQLSKEAIAALAAYVNTEEETTETRKELSR